MAKAKRAPTKHTGAKKVAAKKAALSKADGRRPAAKKAVAQRRRGAAAAALAGYDPRGQLDKLSPSQPDGPTRGTRAGDAASAAPTPRLPDEFYAARRDEPLGDQAMAEAAQALGCEIAAVRAVAEVESRGSGFDAQGRPTMLYERHVFSRNTAPKGRFNAQFPDISFGQSYEKGTFGNGEQQYVKIARAYALDPVAALKAPSWGMFQILGENHKACGFADVKSYALAMFTSPAAHLRAFVAFVRSSPRLHEALIARDWAAFARAYNGPQYAKYEYDKKMAAAYARHKAAV